MGSLIWPSYHSLPSEFRLPYCLKIHREDDKPAMENSSGVYYYKNGFLDRKNKPAIVTETLTEYYKNGKLHRLGEPARIDTKKGIQEYWVNGKKLNIEEIKHQKTLKKVSEF